jgi:4-hydroxyphenylpyruvate dioxygenase
MATELKTAQPNNQTTGKSANIIGIEGIEFVEFATNRPEWMSNLFFDFGFSLLKNHTSKNIQWFKQNKIIFIMNADSSTAGGKFASQHGHSISAMGWRFKDAKKAHEIALKRGAKNCTNGDYPVPAIYGIGDSIIYFLDKASLANEYFNLGFKTAAKPIQSPDKGFLEIDHLTNNVYKGTMEEWSKFYKNIFEFTDVRYFDIKGQQTGLTSHALRSACGTFCIPINEADEKKSQINEYLEMYNGAGIQHLAFLTNDILGSLKKLDNSSIQMLDILPSYYDTCFKRVPNVIESHQEIQKRSVLVDGDDHGYLLQIFTQNIVGPIFIEIIQRKNHLSFGEGNFQALFESIERDQEKRGLFK